MSPPGRPKGDVRSAQHQAILMNDALDSLVETGPGAMGPQPLRFANAHARAT